MTPRIRSLVAAEPLVPSPFRTQKAPQIFRDFIETLQKLHDQPAKPKTRTKPKVRRARKAAK